MRELVALLTAAALTVVPTVPLAALPGEAAQTNDPAPDFLRWLGGTTAKEDELAKEVRERVRSLSFSTLKELVQTTTDQHRSSHPSDPSWSLAVAVLEEEVLVSFLGSRPRTETSKLFEAELRETLGELRAVPSPERFTTRVDEGLRGVPDAQLFQSAARIIAEWRLSHFVRAATAEEIERRTREAAKTGGCSSYQTFGPDALPSAAPPSPESLNACAQKLRASVDALTHQLQDRPSSAPSPPAPPASPPPMTGASTASSGGDTTGSAPESKVTTAPALFGGVSPSVANADQYAREAYEAYANLKAWKKADTSAGRNNTLDGLGDLREATHDLLALRGLRRTVTAEFVPGYVLAVLSDPSKKPAPAPSGSPAPSATTPAAPATPATPAASPSPSASPAQNSTNAVAGYLRYSTRHLCVFCDTEGHGSSMFDLNVGGRIGIQPALTLVTPVASTNPSPTPSPAPTPAASASPSSNPTPQPTPLPAQAANQDAFLFDVAPAAHFHHRSFEAIAFGRWGFTVLTNKLGLVQSGDQGSIVVAAGGDSNGKMAEFWEWGAIVRINTQPLKTLHELNGLVSPALEVGYARKKDARFQQQAGQVVFADGFGRQTFHLAVRGIVVPSPDKDKSRLFKFGFSLDHEWGGTVPKVTRFSIQGDLDLIKALKGN